MSGLPVLGPPTVATEPLAPPRICGRCRTLLEDDPNLDPVAQAGWSLCTPCQAILLPHARKR